jgi:hypothetical protein
MGLAPAQVGEALLEAHLAAQAPAAHRLDVAARAEGGAGAGDQERADRGILAALLDLGAQRRGQVGRQSVARVGPVERDGRDALMHGAQKFICSGVDVHETLLP